MSTIYDINEVDYSTPVASLASVYDHRSGQRSRMIRSRAPGFSRVASVGAELSNRASLRRRWAAIGIPPPPPRPHANYVGRGYDSARDTGE